MGGVSYFAEKGIASILNEESKCRLVLTVRPRAPSAAGTKNTCTKKITKHTL